MTYRESAQGSETQAAHGADQPLKRKTGALALVASRESGASSFRFAIHGPEHVIEELSDHTDLERLLPGLRYADSPHSLLGAVSLRLYNEPNPESMAIVSTNEGWDARISIGDTTSLLYGVVVPAVSAAATEKGFVYLDSAAALGGRGAVLIAGRGKSTALWGLAQAGITLISEDTTLLDANAHTPTVYGAQSRLNVDVRSVSAEASGVDQRGRVRLEANATRWLPSSTASSIVYLDPTPGEATLNEAADVDGRSWITALAADRATGRGKFVTEPFMTAAWAWPKINPACIDRAAALLTRGTKVFRLSGDLRQFTDTLITNWGGL